MHAVHFISSACIMPHGANWLVHAQCSNFYSRELFMNCMMETS